VQPVQRREVAGPGAPDLGVEDGVGEDHAEGDDDGEDVDGQDDVVQRDRDEHAGRLARCGGRCQTARAR
jgi:hypothetical protein